VVGFLPPGVSRKHFQIDAIRIQEKFGVGGWVTAKALFHVQRRNDNAVGKRVSSQFAIDGKRTGPPSAGDGGQYLILGENVSASTLKPYGCTETMLCETPSLKINARHADEKVARS